MSPAPNTAAVEMGTGATRPATLPPRHAQAPMQAAAGRDTENLEDSESVSQTHSEFDPDGVGEDEVATHWRQKRKTRGDPLTELDQFCIRLQWLWRNCKF